MFTLHVQIGGKILFLDFIWSVFRDYFIPTVASAGFLIFLSRNKLTSQRTVNLLMLAAGCIILVMAGEIGGRYFEYLDHPTMWHTLCSVISYAFRPAIPFFIALIPLRKEDIMVELVAGIPLLLNLAFLSTAFYSDIVFTFDEHNTFVRGELGYIPFVIGGLYIAILIIIAFVPLKKGETQEAILCFTMAIVCSTCVVIEAMRELSGVLVSACILSEIFYYIFFLVNKYNHDPLTDALLRVRMYQDIEKIEKPSYLMLFDITGLKFINDTEGNLMGDRALATFSKAVSQCLPLSAKFYRTGGDEFAIIYKGADAIQVSSLYTHIREKSSKLPYGFTYGYASFTNKDDFTEAYKVAGDKLRERKEDFWANYRAAHPEFEA